MTYRKYKKYAGDNERHADSGFQQENNCGLYTKRGRNIYRKILMIALALIFALFIGFIVYFYSGISGGAVREYSHTMAVCNSSNFCQDYVIVCRGNEIVSVEGITGAVVQHSPEWEDFRNNTMLCG